MEPRENEYDSGPGVRRFGSAGTTGWLSGTEQQRGPIFKMSHSAAQT